MTEVSRRSLAVFIEDRRVGTLTDTNGVWTLHYQEGWVDDPAAYDLAPTLPRGSAPITDGGSRRPVQWFFDNLLPEEALRRLLATDARVDEADAFGLLAHFGAESAGAITLLKEDTPQPPRGLQPLSKETLHQRIASLPTAPLSKASPKRMSLAGAQHKLAVVIRNGELFEPVGAEASTHILKPQHPDEDYPNTVINEHFLMRLADKVGINVPPTEVRYVPDAIYLTERFDRLRTDNEIQRTHVLDACQLLGLSRSFKYEQAHAKTLLKCITLCRSKARARQQIFRWVVFNAITGNGDAHLKNLSFHMRADGIDLAPFYDLISTAIYHAPSNDVIQGAPWKTAELSMPIGNAATFGSLTRADVIVFGNAIGLPEKTASRLLDQLLKEIPKQADALYQTWEPATAHPDVPQCEDVAMKRAADLRMVRQIRHTVIREMCEALAVR